MRASRAPRALHQLEVLLAAIVAAAPLTACKTGGAPSEPTSRPVELAPARTATTAARSSTTTTTASVAAAPRDHAGRARLAAEACTRASATECFSEAEAMVDEATTPAATTSAEAALAACTRCALAPPSAFRLLASLREDRDAKAEARDALLAGTRAHPETPSLWVALARAELELGQVKAALSAYATAERLSPDDEELEREHRDALAKHGAEADRVDAKVQGLLTEAAGRAELGDLAGARDTLKVAAGEAAKVPALAALVRHRLALVYVRRAEPKLALEELERALALETAASELRADALVTRSEVLLTLGKAADAIRAAEQAIAIAPKHTLAFADLALARVVSGDRDGALRALGTSVELGLPRRLTRDELLAIPSIDKLRAHPGFQELLDTGWPRSAQPSVAPR